MSIFSISIKDLNGKYLYLQLNDDNFHAREITSWWYKKKVKFADNLMVGGGGGGKSKKIRERERERVKTSLSSVVMIKSFF